jgi:F-type H+-transporting ATPase subunit epsilon
MIHKDAPASSMVCVVVSPDAVLYEGNISKITVPGIKQELAVMPDHTPLYAQLTKGTISIEETGKNMQSFTIDSGIIRVRSNQVTVITGFDVKGEVLGSEKLK